MDLVPEQDGPHTTMKCNVCGITFETWVTSKLGKILAAMTEKP